MTDAKNAAVLSQGRATSALEQLEKENFLTSMTNVSSAHQLEHDLEKVVPLSLKAACTGSLRPHTIVA
jgi:hypothetical protein